MVPSTHTTFNVMNFYDQDNRNRLLFVRMWHNDKYGEKIVTHVLAPHYQFIPITNMLIVSFRHLICPCDRLTQHEYTKGTQKSSLSYPKKRKVCKNGIYNVIRSITARANPSFLCINIAKNKSRENLRHRTDGWWTDVDYGYSWLLIHQKKMARGIHNCRHISVPLLLLLLFYFVFRLRMNLCLLVRPTAFANWRTEKKFLLFLLLLVH